MEEIDKEISEMKISLNARARIVAEEFLKNVILPLTNSLSNLSSSLSLSLSPSPSPSPSLSPSPSTVLSFKLPAGPHYD